MKPHPLIFAFGLALVCSTAAPSRAAGIVSSVSGSARTNLAGSGGSFAPAFSSDGRYVVFVSQANNLVTNDDPAPYLDVFVRDLTTSNTTLVSVNSSGRGGGQGNSNFPTISSNGQFVAFASEADNLVANDTNRASDVFVRDLVSGVTTLVSVDVAGTGSAAACCSHVIAPLSGHPVISANGRWVAFESLATDLVANDTNGLSDLFVRDLQTGATLLVS